MQQPICLTNVHYSYFLPTISTHKIGENQMFLTKFVNLHQINALVLFANTQVMGLDHKD